jgi:hypothetical protein
MEARHHCRWAIDIDRCGVMCGHPAFTEGPCPTAKAFIAHDRPQWLDTAHDKPVRDKDLVVHLGDLQREQQVGRTGQGVIEESVYREAHLNIPELESGTRGCRRRQIQRAAARKCPNRMFETT